MIDKIAITRATDTFDIEAMFSFELNFDSFFGLLYKI